MRRDVCRSGRGRRPQGSGSLLVVWLLLVGLTPTLAHAQGAPADTVTLSWTAPGDDGLVGTAAAYELRVSGSSINDANWGAATVVGGMPTPLPAGTRQGTVVRGLTPGTTYYFAMKTVDEAGNWSGLSNVVRWDWVYDTAPPSAPAGVSAAPQGDGSVRVSWTPNSEPDLAGYNIYRSLSGSGPLVLLNGALLTVPEYLDATIPAGTEMVRYQVTAKDNAGNESARSSTATLSLVARKTRWVMETGYPNPSRAGATVRIPLVVPDGGGNASLEIVNSAGQRVRRLELGTLASGATELRWDGRSDGGREAAPGAYTAWLITGTTRVSVRLVRVP